MDSTLAIRVGTAVGGAPEGLVAQALRDAFAEICRRVPAWTEEREATVPEGFAQGPGARLEGIELPAGAAVQEFRRWRVNGIPVGRGAIRWDEARGCVTDRRGMLRAGDVVAWEAVYVPATHEADVPERTVLLIGNAAVPLAASILLGMPRRPWSDPNAAAMKRQDYLRELTNLIRRCLTGEDENVRMCAWGLVDE